MLHTRLIELFSLSEVMDIVFLGSVGMVLIKLSYISIAQNISHYLSQWWTSFVTYMCVSQLRFFKKFHSFDRSIIWGNGVILNGLRCMFLGNNKFVPFLLLPTLCMVSQVMLPYNNTWFWSGFSTHIRSHLMTPIFYNVISWATFDKIRLLSTQTC